VTTVGTKTTQRIYGANPYQEAVSVTQHIWPAALPENAPNENNNVPDRPWGLTLLTPDDPLTAITATPLIHFPEFRRGQVGESPLRGPTKGSSWKPDGGPPGR
jgi:hypothetical protein